MRLQKLQNAGLMRDQQISAQIFPITRAYKERCELLAGKGIIAPEASNFRWMIEELRVSLYAQDLKTSAPVSIRRLERQLSLLGE